MSKKEEGIGWIKTFKIILVDDQTRERHHHVFVDDGSWSSTKVKSPTIEERFTRETKKGGIRGKEEK